MNLRTLCVCQLAVAAAVLAMPAAASATALESPEGTVYTSKIVAQAEGHTTFDHSLAAIACASTLEGSVESHGESVTASGNLSTLTFTSCTNSWTVKVVAAGSLAVHETELGNGTVTSSGATVEATRFGITCRYATSSTTIGTLTGSYVTGGNATLDIEGSIPFHSGSPFCTESAIAWTGSYNITTPSELTVSSQDVKPGVEFSAPGGADMKKDEEREVSIEDNNGTLDWTLEKVDLVIVKGGWSLPDPSPCASKAVTKKQGFVCKVKIKCTEAGEARFRGHVSWDTPKKSGIPFTTFKCT